MSIDWSRVREDYETKKLTFRELAGLYNCNPSTMCRKAKRYGWRRWVPSGDGEGKADDAPHDLVPGLLKEHRRLWERLRCKVGGELEKKNDLDVKEFKASADAVSVIIKGERQAWGIAQHNHERDGLGEELLEVTKEMEQATVPPGASPALERGEEV